MATVLDFRELGTMKVTFLKASIMVLLSGCWAPAMVHAEFVSTHELKQWLEESEKTGGSFKDRTLAIGYLSGIHDILEHSTVCTPSGLPAARLLKDVHGWIERNPSLLTADAARTVRRAMADLYPCPRHR